MSLLTRLFLTVFVLIVAVGLVGFLLPSDYRVARTVVIDAPPQHVYQNVADLKKWKNWGVWFQRDPQMHIEYSGPMANVGMKSIWESDTQGNGEMIITSLEQNKLVVYDLYFPDMDMRSQGRLTLTAMETGTKVEWSDSGDVGMNPINRYFVLFLDSMLGPDFEAGLTNLKTVSENS